MPAIPRLSAEAIAQAMPTLDGWELVKGERIKKQFTFADFGEAFSFMTLLAPVAEEMDHHPEWSNIYNRVTIEMTTHDVGGLSEYDMTFALRANQIAASIS